MARGRRKQTQYQPRPWTEEEDAKLFDLCRIGATCDLWKTVFPTRRFGEVAERRYELKPPRPPFL
jgi:hypothetical protein